MACSPHPPIPASLVWSAVQADTGLQGTCSGQGSDSPRRSVGGSQHACTDLELGALCLAGGVPGPSSFSTSGSMPEGCSGVAAPLPWTVQWAPAGSRWELGWRTGRIRSSTQASVPGASPGVTRAGLGQGPGHTALRPEP